jgi:hypothetical protein
VTRKAGGEVLLFCSDDRSTRPGEEEAGASGQMAFGDAA